MKVIEVDLAERSYPIYIGDSLLSDESAHWGNKWYLYLSIVQSIDLQK